MPRSRSPAPLALIALGSNDPENPALARNLTTLRSRTTAFRVTWLAPYHARASRIVAAVARSFGDTVIQLSAVPTADGVHPASYRPIAAALDWKSLSENWHHVAIGSARPPAPGTTRPTPVPDRRATVLVME